MRWVWVFFIGLLLLAVEIAVISRMRGLGGGPDLVLLFVIFLALYCPMDDAPLSGWLLGLAKDSLSTGTFGLYAVTYMAVAFILSRMRADIFLEYNISHVANAAASTLFVYVVAAVWEATQGMSMGAMFPTVIGVTVWNAVIAPGVFFVLFRFSRFLDAVRRPG